MGFSEGKTAEKRDSKGVVRMFKSLIEKKLGMSKNLRFDWNWVRELEKQEKLGRWKILEIFLNNALF